MEEKDKALIEYVQKLSIVKDEFIRMKKELAVSIRKDVFKVELKDILNKSTNYETLKNNLEEYIENILDKESTKEDGENK